MIINRQRRVPVAIRPLQQFYERVRRELGFASESVTIELISDNTMARFNKTFRKKQGPTDVLSFPVNGASARRSVLNISETLPSRRKPPAAMRAASRDPFPSKCAS